MFQSSTRQTDFATPFHQSGVRNPSCFNPLRGRQTLQPTGKSNRKMGEGSFNPLRGRQTLQPEAGALPRVRPQWFQSSTRQTDFATATRCGWPTSASWIGFQSSTRQTDFATGVLRAVHGGHHSSFNPLRGRQTLQRRTW